MHTGNIQILFNDVSSVPFDLHHAEMIPGYKFVKGFQVDEERACKLGEVDPTPAERMKSVVVASRTIDRDNYMVTAVGYQVNDPEKTQKFILVLDFGDD